MVEEDRKPTDFDGEMTESSLASSVTVQSGLKLKINLRDRQSLRKRRRSLSPTSSDSSSIDQESKKPASCHSSPLVIKPQRDQHPNGSSTAVDDPMQGKLFKFITKFILSNQT